MPLLPPRKRSRPGGRSEICAYWDDGGGVAARRLDPTNRLKPTVVMIDDKLRERVLIELHEDIAEFLRVAATLRKAFAVSLAQRADVRVPVLATDFAIFVAMTREHFGIGHSSTSSNR